MDSFGNILRMAALILASYVVLEFGPRVVTLLDDIHEFRQTADRGVAAIEAIGKLKFWEPAGAGETCQCGCGKVGCKCGK